MTWTAEHRATYGREGPGFPSNLTDAEWAVLAPLIPQASPGGRPRKTDMRQAMNAIFYLLRTGSPWRYLPHDGFPPRSTVYNIFRKFQADGTWEAIWAELYTLLREREGREASPTAALMDSQTIKSAETYGPPRLQVVCIRWLEQSAQTYPAFPPRRLAKMEIRASWSS